MPGMKTMILQIMIGMLMLIIVIEMTVMVIMSRVYTACKFHLTELRWRSS